MRGNAASASPTPSAARGCASSSQVRFEFYGLPSPFDKEPEAKRMGITGVPTGVVYHGTKEVGRIAGGEWSIPELAIKKVLDGSAPKASR